MENIYNCKDRIQFKLLCKKSVGDKNDNNGRFFEKGKKYNTRLEPVSIRKDTNNERCTLIWVSYNEGFGSRFTVLGNIYHSGKPIWGDFRKVFYCPLELEIERKKKITNIVKIIKNEN